MKPVSLKVFVRLAALATAIVLGWVNLPAHAQKVLFHGGGATATNGSDGAVLSYLQTLFGADNVTYMQGAMAAADGSSADGVDALVVSSTLDSGTILNKYADTPIGVLNWESALTRDDRIGEFFLSEGGATSAAGVTEISIVDSAHPLAAGLSGTVQVFRTPQTASFGSGGLGAGVTRVAGLGADHAILAAETGGPLLGDGGPGSPATAPGPRVMFFLQDSNFDDLTVPGLRLFNSALQFVTESAEPFPVEVAIGGKETIGRPKFAGTYENVTNLPPQDFDGFVRYEIYNFNLGTRTRAGFEASAAANTATFEGLMAAPFVWDDPNYPDEWQSFFPDGTTRENYHVAITGQIFIDETFVDFKDGNDDYALFVVDTNGDGDLSDEISVIDDNTHTSLATNGNGGSTPGFASFLNLPAGGEWRDFLFVMGEGGGGDNASLYWSGNPGFEVLPGVGTAVDQAGHRVPASALRVAGAELIDSADLVVDFTGGATFVFDVIVHELEWDKIGVDVPVIVGNPDAQINGIVDFSGSIVRLELTEDPLPGMTVDLIDNTGVGEIISPEGFEFSHGDIALWDTSQFTINGQITYGGAPQGIIGDYNGNGTVEQADLDLVLLNWGTGGVPGGWVNDLPEGNIDQAELDGVLLNWGNVAALGSGGGAGVPEPGTFILILVAAGLAFGWLKRR